MSHLFEFEQFKRKNSDLTSTPMYISYDNTYFGITNNTKAIVYASYIQQDKFFSNDSFSGKLMISGSIRLL